ncbi:MAG: CDP-alcohol phosphatidyltransferase family protein [Gammaproteobacteria bacterium]|nr:CDP-alcohol phosphatidyltransferase family protein [Gammaproteobacteria bacterium]
MLDSQARRFVEPAFRVAALALRRLGISANAVSLTALLVGLGAAGGIVSGRPGLAIALLWISGCLDAVDGTLARLTAGTPIGAILDITFDRIVETAAIAALAWRHPALRFELLLLVGAIAIAMSLFLSIAAAVINRSVKSFHYAPGLGERTEAFLCLTVMIADQRRLALWSAIFIAMIVVTMAQRLWYAARQLAR